MPKFLHCAIFLATLVISTTASAKGITVALSITGPGLDVPLQTTDPGAIDVSIWGGNFAEFEDGAMAEPPIDLPRYLVHFWAELPRTSTVQLKYVVWYVWDPSREKALIYLPGPRDLWYRTNTRSILRENHDGKWFYATEPWGRAIKQTIDATFINAS
jgi:hypothetical protein